MIKTFYIFFILIFISSIEGQSQTAKEYFESGLSKIGIDNKEALNDFMQAVRIDTSFAEAYYKQGEINIALQDTFSAYYNFKDAIRLDHKFIETYVQSEFARNCYYDNTEKIIDYSIIIKDDPKSNKFYSHGKYKNYNLQHNIEVFSHYNSVVKENEKNKEFFVKRGNVRLNLHDYWGAINDYSKAIALDPNFAVAYCNRGDTKASFGLVDYKGAILDYNKGISIDPKCIECYIGRAKANSRIDRRNYQVRLNDYNKIIELDPKNIGSYKERGLVRSSNKDYNGSISDFTKIIDIDPHNSDAYFWRATIKSKIKNYAGAIEDYQAIIKLKPSDIWWNLPIAQERINLKEFSMAILDANKVISAKPDEMDFTAFFYRGLARYSMANYPSAIEDFTKYLENTKGHDCDAFFFRGSSKYHLNDFSGAIEDLNRALNLSTVNPKAYLERGLCFIMEGKKNLGCNDLAKSKELGVVESTNFIKEYCENKNPSNLISNNLVETYRVSKVQEFYIAEIYGKGFNYIPNGENNQGGRLKIDRNNNTIKIILARPIDLLMEEDTIKSEKMEGKSVVILTSKYKIIINTSFKAAGVDIFNIRFFYEYSSKFKMYSKLVILDATLSNN